MSISLEEHNKIKNELEFYKNLYFNQKLTNCINNVKKINEIYDLKMENDSLNHKLEEKYNNCIDEKIKLKNEIEELKELLNPTKDNSKKRKVSAY
jgi:hypothetical protein